LNPSFRTAFKDKNPDAPPFLECALKLFLVHVFYGSEDNQE